MEATGTRGRIVVPVNSLPMVFNIILAVIRGVAARLAFQCQPSKRLMAANPPLAQCHEPQYEQRASQGNLIQEEACQYQQARPDHRESYPPAPLCERDVELLESHEGQAHGADVPPGRQPDHLSAQTNTCCQRSPATSRNPRRTRYSCKYRPTQRQVECNRPLRHRIERVNDGRQTKKQHGFAATPGTRRPTTSGAKRHRVEPAASASAAFI